MKQVRKRMFSALYTTKLTIIAAKQHWCMHEIIVRIRKTGPLKIFKLLFQTSLGLVVESLSQDGVKFRAQMLLELSWYTQAELVALNSPSREEQQKKFVCLRILIIQVRQQACPHMLNTVECLALNTNLMLVHKV
jgi:hypothetical protein